MATTIIAGSSAKPLMKMKPKPSTMFSAPGSTGPAPRSLNSGNSTAPTTIIPATRHAARKANRITNSRPNSAITQIHSRQQQKLPSLRAQAKQSRSSGSKARLLRRFAPCNDELNHKVAPSPVRHGPAAAEGPLIDPDPLSKLGLRVIVGNDGP